ncbi:uncharacterized protein LOC121401634 isoform X1 [Xenopus laevis]|uniref:Uncharacterized protein LOC121401634 isoform X1 n=2 Tax=Xenopus laevis TaxID=8355 RepID=A0A8J1MN38_XENLA|nr:uncharacterized protein LOC121401634 isoform X1 [Xenopus laevis]
MFCSSCQSLVCFPLLINCVSFQLKQTNQPLPTNINYEKSINGNVEPTVAQTEDSLIEGQAVPIPAETQTSDDRFMDISSIIERFDAKEAKVLKLLDSVSATINDIRKIEEKIKDTESRPSDISYLEELNRNISKEGTISKYLFWSCVFVSGALMFSLCLNIKLTRKNKAIARAKEARPSVAAQTDFQTERAHPLLQDMLKALDDSGESDDESDLEGVDMEDTKKRKKKRFCFNVRKYFGNCLKRRNKKKKTSVNLHHETSNESEEYLSEISDETEESYNVYSSSSEETTDSTSIETVGSDESITASPGKKKKRGFNVLLCGKKCKTLDSDDRESSKGKKKYIGLKLGKYFCRYKRAKRKRREKTKKCLWRWCHHKASGEEEESPYETPDESEESSDETLDVTEKSYD